MALSILRHGQTGCGDMEIASRSDSGQSSSRGSSRLRRSRSLSSVDSKSDQEGTPITPWTDDGSISSHLSLKINAQTTSEDLAVVEDRRTEHHVLGTNRAVEDEFARIQDSYPALRSTGCTERFCQAGRMIKTDEPRVGKRKSMATVQAEAVDFLHQLHRDDVIKSQNQLENRIRAVLGEIEANTRLASEASRDTRVPRPKQCHRYESTEGGHWRLSKSELEHGVRLAWKHSRNCIMRSEYRSLEVVDLQHIATSREMGTELISALKLAFSDGKITPSVFVFPPSQVGRRGPMIWNSQLLSFAGYRNDDGSILGDPANADLTEAIIELGWTAPVLRTQWDLLPIVTMAEDDVPFITEIPKDVFPLVYITHPKHELAFEKLGLRWVPAPALSRLGFDIGGVQYTAAPFIGWFMDAEIGVRNLVDSFRYNVLPRLITALGWIDTEQDLERAPEHERLALLSKAQAELNYAVYHSFAAAGVKMTDSLSASSMYSNFDDEHFKEKGFRLPSNPYWIAPPQGSIVPIWHRGGAPNYQPTPMICRHVQDPVKAWKREVCKRQISEQEYDDSGRELLLSEPLQRCPFRDLSSEATSESGPKQDSRPKVYIMYCSAASTARKLALDLYRRLSEDLARSSSQAYQIMPVTTLNEFSPQKLDADDFAFIVASTAGHGEVPANGARFEKRITSSGQTPNFRFSIFGNGSSTYQNTYNDCAKILKRLLLDNKAQSLGSGLFDGDTAKEDPPWQQFDSWVYEVRRGLKLISDETAAPPVMATVRSNELPTKYHSVRLLPSKTHKNDSGIMHVVLDVGRLHYQPLSYVSLIPPNAADAVQEALHNLGLSGKERVNEDSGMSSLGYLRDFVDFERPFVDMSWTQAVGLSHRKTQLLRDTPLRQALPLLKRAWARRIHLNDLFNAMPFRAPRMFSTASCQRYLTQTGKKPDRIELLVQSRPRGLIGEFLRQNAAGASLKMRVIDTDMDELLQHSHRPLICFATGSGLAPVRSLLQHRLAQQNCDKSEDGKYVAPITLILGFKQQDTQLIFNAIEAPLAAGLVDILLLTPSNPAQARAQDRVFELGVRDRIEKKLKEEEASIFVCASATAAGDFAANVSALLGRDVQAALGDRYVQEVFKPAC